MMKNSFFAKLEPIDVDCPRNETVDFLAQKLQEKLTSAASVGTVMPPVRHLAALWQVAPQTIRKVYQKLADAELIFCPPGKKIWRVKELSCQNRCLGLVLPCSFNHYFQLLTPPGMRHFHMYSGIVERATQKHLSTTPLYLPPPDASADLIAASLSDIKKTCCGVVHFGDRGFEVDRPLFELLKQNDLPQVSINCQFDAPNIGVVSFEPRQAMALFVNYMWDLGHQRLAVVVRPPQDVRRTYVHYMLLARSEIQRFFVAAGGRPEDLSIITFDLHNPPEQRQKLANLLKSPDAPTAYLCRDDELACSFMNFVQSLGLAIPQDLSVIGFNNLYPAEKFSPPLSTIYNPLYELGQEVVDHLLSYRTAAVSEKNRYTWLSPHLVVRNSAGHCKKNIFDL